MSKRTLMDNSVLSRMNYPTKINKYTIEQFERIAKWDSGDGPINVEFTRKPVVFKNRNLYISSKIERKFINRLLKPECVVLDIGTQALCIKYKSEWANNKEYYPDIVFLNKNNRIGIIEAKSVTAMSYHLNITKYKRLIRYCNNQYHGYMYLMADIIDGKIISFEDLVNMPINKQLQSIVMKWKKTNKKTENYFDKATTDEWYDLIGKDNFLSKMDFQLQIHSLIINLNLYNVSQNGFRVYSHPVKVNRDTD